MVSSAILQMKTQPENYYKNEYLIIIKYIKTVKFSKKII